jgi:hypothetical protein
MKLIMIAGARAATWLAFTVEITVKAAHTLPSLHFLLLVLSVASGRYFSSIIALLAFHVSKQRGFATCINEGRGANFRARLFRGH